MILSEIVIASNNLDKIREIKEILHNIPIKLLSLSDFPDMPEVIEDQDTLEGNAIKKARVIAEYTNKPALADDTGLEVDFLDGRPGVYTARYAGENATYKDNINKLLEELQNVSAEKRRAYFHCVMALVFPDTKKTYTSDGICEGYITEEPKGENGFGYDPVFLISEYNQTFAELGDTIKHTISHRGKALRSMQKIIETLSKYL